MPWIENAAKVDIVTGFHHKCGDNSMLIGINDPAGWPPTALHKFKERHDFEFLDIEANDFALDEAMRCSQEQANELVRLLQQSLDVLKWKCLPVTVLNTRLHPSSPRLIPFMRSPRNISKHDIHFLSYLVQPLGLEPSTPASSGRCSTR